MFESCASTLPGTPRPTSSLWLFQLDDSTSLDGKWLEITKHPLKTGCLEFQVIFKCGRSNATTEMPQPQ